MQLKMAWNRMEMKRMEQKLSEFLAGAVVDFRSNGEMDYCLASGINNFQSNGKQDYCLN